MIPIRQGGMWCRARRWACGFGALSGMLSGGTCIAAGSVRIIATSEGPRTTVRVTTADARAEAPLLQVTWTHAPGGNADWELTRGTAVVEGFDLMLDRIIEAGIGAYLDARLRYTRTGVVPELPAMAMAGEMNAMIASASGAMGVGDAALSPATLQQLARFVALDWSATADLPSVRSGSQDKYLVIYRVLQAQRAELDRQVHADLVPLAAVPVVGDAPNGDPRTSYRIASTCGTVFDDENFLCALELGMEEGDLPVVVPMFTLAQVDRQGPTTRAGKERATASAARIRARDRWMVDEFTVLAGKLDAQQEHAKGLEERIRDLEDGMAGLLMEVREMKREAPAWELPYGDEGRFTLAFHGPNNVLAADQRARLDALASYLEALPELRVVVMGVVAPGSVGKPDRQADERAAIVRSLLLEQGVAASQVLLGVARSEVGQGRAGVVIEAL